MAKIKTGPKVKRKGGGIPAKSRAVDALAEQLRGSTAVIVTDYRGLKVGEMQDLRKRLRPKGVEYHVVKNSLFTRDADSSRSSADRRRSRSGASTRSSSRKAWSTKRASSRRCASSVRSSVVRRC